MYVISIKRVSRLQVYIILYAVVQKVVRATGCWQIERLRRAIQVSLKSYGEEKNSFRFTYRTCFYVVLQRGTSEPIYIYIHLNNIITMDALCEITCQSYKTTKCTIKLWILQALSIILVPNIFITSYEIRSKLVNN